MWKKPKKHPKHSLHLNVHHLAPCHEQACASHTSPTLNIFFFSSSYFLGVHVRLFPTKRAQIFRVQVCFGYSLWFPCAPLSLLLHWRNCDSSSRHSSSTILHKSTPGDDLLLLSDKLRWKTESPTTVLDNVLLFQHEPPKNNWIQSFLRKPDVIFCSM